MCVCVSVAVPTLLWPVSWSLLEVSSIRRRLCRCMCHGCLQHALRIMRGCLLGCTYYMYSNTPRSFLKSLPALWVRGQVCCAQLRQHTCGVVAGLQRVVWHSGLLSACHRVCWHQSPSFLSLFGATTPAPLGPRVFFCPQQDVDRALGALARLGRRLVGHI